jgi:hypothetical protein
MSPVLHLLRRYKNLPDDPRRKDYTDNKELEKAYERSLDKTWSMSLLEDRK